MPRKFRRSISQLLELWLHCKVNMKLSHYVLFFTLYLSLCFPTYAADDSFELSITGGTEISIERFGRSDTRILWLPHEMGFSEHSYTLAEQMAAQGLEIWLANLHDSYFISPNRTSLQDIPQYAIAELIELSLPKQAQQRLLLMSSGRGAALALHGLHDWQQARSEDSRFAGAILVHPNLAADSPQPGQDIEWLPIASQTQTALMVIQPKNSAKHWYLQELVGKLQNGGSRVYYKTVSKVSDGYLSRLDRSEIEAQQASNFPQLLRQSSQLLIATQPEHTQQISNKLQWQQQQKSLPEGLQPYPEVDQAPALAQLAVDKQRYDLKDYRGKVVLLNFWATWCPPCVEEIPSLNRLQQRFAKDEFQVLSVDIGETATDVAQFLQDVPADYPVLLDPDGKLVESWKLRAFPTTFVIDQQGDIRMAYFGALEWDSEQVVNTLQQQFQLKPLPKPKI